MNGKAESAVVWPGGLSGAGIKTGRVARLGTVGSLTFTYVTKLFTLLSDLFEETLPSL
jgi:hypothetical protein